MTSQTLDRTDLEPIEIVEIEEEFPICDAPHVRQLMVRGLGPKLFRIGGPSEHLPCSVLAVVSISTLCGKRALGCQSLADTFAKAHTDVCHCGRVLQDCWTVTPL